MFGALDVTAGTWAYRLGRRGAADFITFLDQLLRTFPRPGDRGDLRQRQHPPRQGGHRLPGAPSSPGTAVRRRYSPHDNPAERIWGALKNYVANTAVSWPGRRRQIHAFFRARSPDQLLAAAAPWTSPWLPPGHESRDGRQRTDLAPLCPVRVSRGFRVVGTTAPSPGSPHGARDPRDGAAAQ